jgi:phosphoribosylaminoimidazole-succinocarboxamide synthase
MVGLEDFKFEVGVDKNRNFILIDEVSPDCSRIRTKSGDSLTKDLFRQRKPEHEICHSYKLLADAIEKKVKVF